MSERLKRNIGRRLRAARQQQGLTQAELAEAIDKAFETISNIERGKAAPSFSTLAALSDAMSLPLRDLFDFGDDEVTEERQDLLNQINMLVGRLTDAQLRTLLKLGAALEEA